MSQADRTANNVEPFFFHPVSHYDSPDAVSTDEKLVILSSGASDMYVVESHPALRQIPGIPHGLHLDDILATLRRLDDDDDPPPRGGLAMRLPRFSKLECTASEEPATHSPTGTPCRGGTGRCKPRAESFTMDARGKCAAISQAPQHAADRH